MPNPVRLHQDHLGYRIELQKSTLYFINGDVFRIEIALVNWGFSAPKHKGSVELVLGITNQSPGTKVINVDWREWLPNTASNPHLIIQDVNLAGLPKPNHYYIGLRIRQGGRIVRLANREQKPPFINQDWYQLQEFAYN
jgi:hypothetical protein